MSKVWFTSDSHYGHKNIIRSLSSWTDKGSCRDFVSMESMNNALVEGINAVVAPDDTLYHLGDFNFGALSNLREFRSRIKCGTIHLLKGNHDFKHGSVDPATVDHGFESVDNYKEIIVEDQEIVLCHYAHRVWNNQGKGSWHLYGHSHGSLPRLKNFSVDVGVEGLGEFNPVPLSMSNLRLIFFNDSISPMDHHNEKTQNASFRC
jgi:calcineurin-like phosphoesterase family protein